MEPRIWALLSQADRALGRLDGSTEVLPNPDLFVLMYVRKEAVLSAQIEGTQASLAEVLELEAKVLDTRHPSDAFEIVNYIAAMTHGLDRLKEFPLSLRLVREIHGKILQSSRGSEKSPGEFRTSQNWIGPAGSTLKSAKFVPPPPEAMRAALGDWEVFLHRDKGLTPELIEIGLAHAQFETIHPFLDGNGRVGRLLITFLLCERGILRRPLLYLSYYFKRNRSEYYTRLQAVRDEGDWEGWVEFFLQGVVQVAQSATETARAIIVLRERHRGQITASMARSAGTAMRLLDALYDHPVMTVSLAVMILDIKFPNANVIVKRFADLGILKEVTGGERNRVYVYHEYLELFDDEEIQASEAPLEPIPEAMTLR